jgi:hypothetical protein
MELEFRKSPESLAVLVVGTDTVIEALPARPIQLAHACGELGFDLVVPLSWGDELVAEAALRSLETGSPKRAVFCACPLVRQRLLQSGTDLSEVMLSFVSPPVAVARHLRASIGPRLGSLTYVGRCPGADAQDFDVTYEPTVFLDILRDRGIELESQPDSFIDRLPADRRRHLSLPGGCPAPEPLWQRCHEMLLSEVDGPDLSLEIAQHLLSSQPVLVDLAISVGCHCCGVTSSSIGSSARVAVTSLEPPRSVTPVISDSVVSELSAPVTDDASSFQQATYGGLLSSSIRPPMAVTPPSALSARR